MAAAVFGLLGVVIGGLLNAGVTWFFENTRARREAQAITRILLVEVNDALAKFVVYVHGGQWVETEPIEWTMWATQRQVLAHAVTDNEAWLSLANLAITVTAFNRWYSEATAGQALTDAQKARLREGMSEAASVMNRLLHVARGDHAKKEPERRIKVEA